MKNEALARDFLQKWKVECRADGLVQMRFAIFHFICVKCCACHAKVMPGNTKLHLSRKIILANLKIWCSKMQPLSGNQRPDLLISLMHMYLVLRLPPTSVPSKVVRACVFFNNLNSILFAPQRRALFEHFNFKKCSDAGVLCTFWLRNVIRATRACTFSTSQLLKVFWSWGVCAFWLPNLLRATAACTFSTFLTSKCASRHNGV